MSASEKTALMNALDEAQATEARILDISRDRLGCILGISTVAWFAQAVCERDIGFIKGLKACGQPLGATGITCLSRLFARITSIELLLLERCSLGDDGLRALAHTSRILYGVKTLDLDDNAISAESLNDWLGGYSRLTRLETLRVSNNPIQDDGAFAFARFADRLPSLYALDVARCGITYLGFEALLGAVTRLPWNQSLRRLYIRHNPLANDSLADVSEMLTESADIANWHAYAACRSHLRYTFNWATVHLLGQGGVGKTHVRRRLFERQAEYYDANEDETRDFDNTLWTQRMAIGRLDETVTVRVFDFGGQPELLRGHRLFLTGSRSVYIIVCDATRTREENRLDYWLRFIAHEGSSNSPVFIVVTKCDLFDKETGDFSERRLELLDVDELRLSAGLAANTSLDIHDGMGWSDAAKARYGPKRLEEHLNCIGVLQQRLVEVMPLQTGLNNRYPRRLVRVLLWIEQEAFVASNGTPLPYIPMNAIRQKCSEYALTGRDITSVGDIADSIGLVHYAGARIPLREGDELAELLFNPDWVRFPIYRLLREGRETSTRGVLSWQEIARLLPEHDGDEKALTVWQRIGFAAPDRVRIVDLMVACGLMFRINWGKSETRYFVPDHLCGRQEVCSPAGDHVWARGFAWLSDASFGTLIGKLHQAATNAPRSIWRNEITFATNEHVEVTVRLTVPIHRAMSAMGDRPGSIVFVAVRGEEEEREAERAMERIATLLADIIGEGDPRLIEWHKVDQGCSRAGEDDGNSQVRYVFRRVENNIWAVAFGSEQLRFVEDCVGFRLIANLLARPGESIRHVELLGRPSRPLVVSRTQPQWMMSKPDEERLRNRIEELNQRMESSDPADAVEAKEERDALLQHLEGARRLGRHRAQLGDENKRLQNRVNRAIDLALKRLGACDPRLADYLRAHIGPGLEYYSHRYGDLAGPPWDVSEDISVRMSQNDPTPDVG